MLSETARVRSGLSNIIKLVLVFIVIVIASAVTYLALSSSFNPVNSSSLETSTNAFSNESSTSYLTTSSVAKHSSNSTTAQLTSNKDSLVIDATLWPAGDLNQLSFPGVTPFPNWLAYTVYQPLITVNETAEYNYGYIQFLPGLAENWTVSPNGTNYGFNLRHGVTFSNGDPLNAYQVWMQMYLFYYLVGNGSSWFESYEFFNMSDVRFGPSTISQINQSGGLINPSQQTLSLMENSSWPIYVTGQYSMVFRLQSPFAYFPGTLVAFDGLILDSQWVLENGGPGTPTTTNNYFNQHPIPGTGPYIVDQVSENSYVSFVQNPNYWGKNLSAEQISVQPLFDPGHAKSVLINVKSNDLARYSDLSSGTAQLVEILPSDWELVLQNSEYSYLTIRPGGGEVSMIALNMNLFPTNITLIRQAIVHAINYSDLYAKAFEREMSPYMGPEYPEWKQYYDLGNFEPYQFNLSLAREDLTKANITNLPVFVMRTQSQCNQCLEAAQVVQTDLEQIGITVQIELLDGGTYSSVYGSYSNNVNNSAQEGQLTFNDGGVNWAPATLTPLDYWVTFVSNQSLYGNWAGYSNPIVQKCIDSFTQTTNPSVIQSLCSAAQLQIYNDAPYAWVGTDKLWLPLGGSIVWKSTVIRSFLVDPVFGGQTTEPIFNTVTFA